jgi:hypothetical protein
MCRIVEELADLNSGKRLIVADVGSGFSAPALQWKLKYNNYLDVICLDINCKQLSTAAMMPAGKVTTGISTNDYCKARVGMDGDNGVTIASILFCDKVCIIFKCYCYPPYHSENTAWIELLH